MAADVTLIFFLSGAIPRYCRYSKLRFFVLLLWLLTLLQPVNYGAWVQRLGRSSPRTMSLCVRKCAKLWGTGRPGVYGVSFFNFLQSILAIW